MGTHLKDFVVTVVTAVLWLSASAALANGVINMKYLGDPANWIFAVNLEIFASFDLFKF